jgi:hypothetical protein
MADRLDRGVAGQGLLKSRLGLGEARMGCGACQNAANSSRRRADLGERYAARYKKRADAAVFFIPASTR